MKTTVITPTIVSRSTLLSECIESVSSQEVLPEDHIIAVDLHGIGPSKLRNKAVNAAGTEWISFLDDDDIMYSDHIKMHSELFNSDLDVIYTSAMMSHPDGSRHKFGGHLDKERILSGFNTLPVTVSIRRDTFLSVGGFNETARYEDLDLWQRLIRQDAKFKTIDHCTWEYRIQPNGRNSEE